jgi:hypothetical protein
VGAEEEAAVPESRATDPIKEMDGPLPVVVAPNALPAAEVPAEVPAAAPVRPASAEVTLVYPWRLRAAARAMLGTFVSCGACGRGGEVARLKPAKTRRWCR